MTDTIKEAKELKAKAACSADGLIEWNQKGFDVFCKLITEKEQQAREIERLKEALRFIEKGGLMGCNAEYREIAANALKLEEGK